KVPALGNVRDTEPPGVLGMLAGLPAVKNVTLCSVSNVHVTVPPRAMVAGVGWNWVPVVAVTAAVEAAGCVTVTVTSLVLVTEPIVPVAVMTAVPAATPVTTPAL